MAKEVGQIRGGFDIIDFNKETEIDLNTYSGDKPKDQSDREKYLMTKEMPFEEGQEWIKLGIQAPPGSKWKINTNEILIGRTGMYELDEDIVVNSLKYISGPFVNVIIDYIVKGASN